VAKPARSSLIGLDRRPICRAPARTAPMGIWGPGCPRLAPALPVT